MQILFSDGKKKQEKRSSQTSAVVSEAQENASWRCDNRGVRAGGDLSGSRRHISIQNHTYGFRRVKEKGKMTLATSRRIPRLKKDQGIVQLFVNQLEKMKP